MSSKQHRSIGQAPLFHKYIINTRNAMDCSCINGVFCAQSGFEESPSNAIPLIPVSSKGCNLRKCYLFKYNVGKAEKVLAEYFLEPIEAVLEENLVLNSMWSCDRKRCRRMITEGLDGSCTTVGPAAGTEAREAGRVNPWVTKPTSPVILQLHIRGRNSRESSLRVGMESAGTAGWARARRTVTGRSEATGGWARIQEVDGWDVTFAGRVAANPAQLVQLAQLPPKSKS
ncbi:hypothetical protein EV426DRAFT_571012 [Tirmania nivea]|nr:hypothetical protein EV426DRAFT_571012 [Tirmania nivea]